MARSKTDSEGFIDRFINLPIFLYKKGDKVIITDLTFTELALEGIVAEDMMAPLSIVDLINIEIKIDVPQYATSMVVNYTQLKLKSENNEDN